MSDAQTPFYFKNGEPIGEKHASAMPPTIALESRAFLYGESAFETMRVEGGRIFRLEDHLRRLARSCSALALQLGLDVEDLASELHECAAASGFSSASLRLTVVRSETGAGIRIPNPSRADRYAKFAPFTGAPEDLYESGIRAFPVRCEVLREFPAAVGKLGNYATRIAALEAATRAGAEEALLVSWDGFVLGGSTSNVFYFRDGALATPPLRAGILDGITRLTVLEIAREVGLAVHEEWLPEGRLGVVDEMFFTSSLRGPVPIRGVEGHAGFTEKRPVFSLIRSRYLEKLRGTAPRP